MTSVKKEHKEHEGLLKLLKKHFNKDEDEMGDEMNEEMNEMPKKKKKKKGTYEDAVSKNSPYMYDDDVNADEGEGFEQNEYDQSEENEDEDEAEGYDDDGEYGEYDEDEESGEDEDGLMPRSRMPKSRRKDLAIAVIAKKISKGKRKGM